MIVGRLVGALGVVLLSITSLAACTSSSTEDDVTAAVEHYVALLGDGKAEAADALDTYDPSKSACPELFTDAVYGTVADRPTGLDVVRVNVHEAHVYVYATLDVAGRRAASVTFRLIPDDKGGWLVDNAASNPLSDRRGVNFVGTGVVSVQGLCPTALPDRNSEAYFGVPPGTWTVSYTDPAGVGSDDEASASVPGTLYGWTNRWVEFEPVPDPAAIAALNDALAGLVDECTAALLDAPTCPASQTMSALHPVARVDVTDPPDARVWDNGDGTWGFTSLTPVSWVDTAGTVHETLLHYYGTFVVNDDGSATLDLAE